MAPGLRIVLGLSSALVILFVLMPAPLRSAADAAAKSLF